MASLYELSKGLRRIDLIIEQNDGVIPDDLDAQLSLLEEAHEQKIENIAKWVKSLIADASNYRAEAKDFTEKARAAEAKAERLKDYILQNRNGLTKAGVIQLKVRASEAVEIDDLDELPEEFKQYKPTAKKTEIKSELKAGLAVPGARLVERENLTVV